MKLSILVVAFTVLCASQSFAMDNDRIAPHDNQLQKKIEPTMKDFQHSLDAQDYPSALSNDRKIITLVDNGKQSKGHAQALHNLAKVQPVVGLHVKSAESYKSNIDLVERQHGIFAPDLLPLLTELSSLYYNRADYELAMNTLRRAQHITHRNEGVYSLEQLTLIDSLTMLEIKTGRIENADTQQRFYYSINLKNYGKDDQRILPAINRMAEWFSASGQLDKSLRFYKKALDVINKLELGEAEKLRPLRGLSTVKYLKGFCCIDEHLREALRIIMTHPGSDHVDKLDALVHLADMHMINKKRRIANQYYQDAWNRLRSGNPATQALFNSPELLGVSGVEDVHKAYYLTIEGPILMDKKVYLSKNSGQSSLQVNIGQKRKPVHTPIIGEPLSLCHSQVLELARTNSTEDLGQYFVDLSFTVTSGGSVRNVSLLDSNAPSRLQRYVTNTLRQTRYRPTFWQGEAIDSKNLKIRQTFSGDRATQESRTPFSRTNADGKRATTLGCQLLASR